MQEKKRKKAQDKKLRMCPSISSDPVSALIAPGGAAPGSYMMGGVLSSYFGDWGPGPGLAACRTGTEQGQIPNEGGSSLSAHCCLFVLTASKRSLCSFVSLASIDSLRRYTREVGETVRSIRSNKVYCTVAFLVWSMWLLFC